MCGILGSIEFDSCRITEGRFNESLSMVGHRGPDSSGNFFINHQGEFSQFSSVAVSLGHCRLSIFDQTAAGNQPMADSKGRQIVYNGEIFNWPEIREELVGYGYRFTTETDTEVILAAYDYWGVECVKQFNGFWAFAIYDVSTNPQHPIVFISRDRFGIKPFYYFFDKTKFLFCSEIKPISFLLGAQPSIDVELLARYLILGLSHDSEKTLYEGMKELEPGCSACLELSNGNFTIKRYWDFPVEPDLQLTDKEALESFSDIFEDAVRIRLRADREVALTLSGGIDSSAIAVAASRVTQGLRAFTSHFPNNPEIDETRYASLVTKVCKLEHELVQPDLHNLGFEEQRLSQHQELLYVSFSMLVNWAVQRAIKEKQIVVTLTGQGGDELFLGYERYFTPRIVSSYRKPNIMLKEFFGAGRNSRLGLRGIMAFVPYFSFPMLRNKRYLQEASKVFRKEFIQSTNESAQRLPLDRRLLQQDQIGGQQLRRLLRYDDRTSSAFGMENRPAMLDYRLVEFAYRLPWKQKIRNGWTKYLIRKYLEKAGLPEIAWRKQKLGFNAPTNQWTQNLLTKRGRGLLQSEFARSILVPGLTIDNLGTRNMFKVFNLLSTADVLNWKPIQFKSRRLP